MPGDLGESVLPGPVKARVHQVVDADRAECLSLAVGADQRDIAVLTDARAPWL